MSEVLQANIFFFITSVAVIIFSLLLCVAMFYIIKILRAVRNIIDRVDTGSENIAEDISQLRNYLAEGSLFSHIIGLFTGSGQKKRRKKVEEDES